MKTTEQTAREAYWKATAFVRDTCSNASRATYRQMVAKAKSAYLAAIRKG